jgi:hypothetical protein
VARLDVLEELKHVVALSAVVGYCARCAPRSTPAGGGDELAAPHPWSATLFHSFSRGRKTFSPNSIEEWFLGEGR